MGNRASRLRGSSKGSSAGAHYTQTNKAGANDPSYIPYLRTGNTGDYSSSPLPPIPIEWIVAPSSVSSVQCPTVGDTMNSFIISDVVSAVITVFIGCRPILHWLSCGRQGKPPLKRSGGCNRAWYSWIFGFTMDLLGNVAASLVVVKTPGYENLYMPHVFTLYATRPRVKILFVAVLRVLVAVRTKDGCNDGATEPQIVAETGTGEGNHAPLQQEQKNANSGSVSSTAQDTSDTDNPEQEEVAVEDTREYVYLGEYRSTAISELILHIISAVFIGVTWGRFPNEEIKTAMSFERIFLQLASGVLFLGITLAVPVFWKRGKVWGKRRKSVQFAVVAFGVVYAAPWIYWNSFLDLPGSLWCPPQLPVQTTVWVIFSTIASLVG